MEINKVEYNGEVLIDLTGDTVTPETLVKGYTAHAANGEIIEGLHEDKKEVPWERPAEWPDLDSAISAEEQVIYYTIDNTARDILFAIQLNIRNYKVEILDNNFNLLKTYTSNNVSWTPAAGYFNDIDVDYPVIKITASDKITSVALKSPYSKTGVSISSRLFINIVEAYYKLPSVLNVSYFTTYLTQHVKLINCTSLTSFYQAFQDARHLKFIELENCDTSAVTSYRQMCWANYSLDDVSFLKDLDCSNCTTLQSMFYACYNLSSIDLSLLKNTEKVTDISQILYSCNHLSSFKISGENFPLMTTCKNMLSSVGVLDFVDLSGLDVTNVEQAGMLNNAKIFTLKLPKGFSQSLNMTNYINSRVELLEFLNQLDPLPSGVTATITVGSGNLRFLTDEEKAAVTQKGWTLA